MSFCSKCGAKLPEDAICCSSCGAPVNQNNTQGAQQNNQQNFQQSYQQSNQQNTKQGNQTVDFSGKVNKFFDTPDSTGEFTKEDIESGKGISSLAYLSLLFLIPLFAAKDNRYVRYHVNQGIVLFITIIAWGVCKLVLSAVLGLWMGWLLRIGDLLLLAFVVLGIYNAVTGKAKQLPLIGRIKILN